MWPVIFLCRWSTSLHRENVEEIRKKKSIRHLGEAIVKIVCNFIALKHCIISQMMVVFTTKNLAILFQ